MATVVYSQADERSLSRVDEPINDLHGWGFAILLLTTATLFLRPADLIPSLDKWPIYQVLIIGCVAVSARALFRQLRFSNLVERPATASLILLLFAVGMSHLSHGLVWNARHSMMVVAKLLILYGLIVALVNTPSRLFGFVKWLTLAITLMGLLALLDQFDYISIAALESITDGGALKNGIRTSFERIRGTGIFQDPNDFGLILVTGIVLSASFLFQRSVGLVRYVWMVPLGILLYSLSLTHSRGAFLSLMSAVVVLLSYFRGGKYAVVGMLGFPLFAIVFSSRMTDVNAINEGTGQVRLQIWSESLAVFRQYPIFGIGESMIVDELGVVTHNSFLQCFAELGFFGGTVFVACFLGAGLSLWSWRAVPALVNPATANGEREQCTSTRGLRCETASLLHQEKLVRLNGFVLAALTACCVAMLTISRQFLAPTYLILGLATATHSVLSSEFTAVEIPKAPRLGRRFYLISAVTSAASLVAFYVAIRFFVRW